jgi:hypothetical protein
MQSLFNNWMLITNKDFEPAILPSGRIAGPIQRDHASGCHVHWRRFTKASPRTNDPAHNGRRTVSFHITCQNTNLKRSVISFDLDHGGLSCGLCVHVDPANSLVDIRQSEIWQLLRQRRNVSTWTLTFWDNNLVIYMFSFFSPNRQMELSLSLSGFVVIDWTSSSSSY